MVIWWNLMRIYPQVINHGNWKSPFSTQVFTKNIQKWGIFHGHGHDFQTSSWWWGITNPAKIFSKKKLKNHLLFSQLGRDPRWPSCHKTNINPRERGMNIDLCDGFYNKEPKGVISKSWQDLPNFDNEPPKRTNDCGHRPLWIYPS